MIEAMSIFSGLGMGLCFGLELARRAYRDTAHRFSRSNEILAQVYDDIAAIRGIDAGEGE